MHGNPNAGDAVAADWFLPSNALNECSGGRAGGQAGELRGGHSGFRTLARSLATQPAGYAHNTCNTRTHAMHVRAMSIHVYTHDYTHAYTYVHAQA